MPYYKIPHPREFLARPTLPCIFRVCPLSCSALPTLVYFEYIQYSPPHHLVSLLDVQLGELVGALLEASARHDGQVDRPPEVNQVLLGQVVDLVSAFGTSIAEA